MTEQEIKALPGGALAYLGDAVFELTVRKMLVSRGITNPGALNREALKFVTASAQSNAVEKILILLNQDELEIYKRGRNVNSAAPPRSATQGEYRRATGVEALFAYLYLINNINRLEELFSAGFDLN